mgnify:CR=1 FL=1
MEPDILDYDEDAPEKRVKPKPEPTKALIYAVGMVFSVFLPWYRVNDVHLLNPLHDPEAVAADSIELARELAHLGAPVTDIWGYQSWIGWIALSAAVWALINTYIIVVAHNKKSAQTNVSWSLTKYIGWVAFLVGGYAFIILRHSDTTLGVGNGHADSSMSTQIGVILFALFASLFVGALKAFPSWLKDMLISWGPAIIVVLVLRNTLAEPFRIPSGSMVPTLQIGDHILVSKISYGLRIPYTDWEIISFGEPERGDVIVFRYPEEPAVDYIKRIVGQPGDTVQVRNDQVYVNGEQAVQTRESGQYPFVNQLCETRLMNHYTEDLLGVEHEVLDYGRTGHFSNYRSFTVPEGYFFMMGDNRHNSKDSRSWGLVPREFVKGRANWVWLSYNQCEGTLPVFGSFRLARLGESIN